jgi:hypothetical protein
MGVCGRLGAGLGMAMFNGFPRGQFPRGQVGCGGDTHETVPIFDLSLIFEEVGGLRGGAWDGDV